MSQQIKPQAEYHPDEVIFIQSRAEINPAIVGGYAAMMGDGNGVLPLLCAVLTPEYA
jgi:hypothetical protein